jgi:XTP/dITP diphosphohydrolase
LLVASFNPGKARELARLAETAGVATIGLPDVGISEPYEETGSTYEENARGKALHYAGLSGLPTVADDSGLEVEALGGAPGHLSARYGGPGLDDAMRCRRLLRDLAGVPDERRAARYVAVAALAGPDGTARLFRGECRGRIAHEALGARGFGYDPVFFYPPFESTFGQVEAERKNEVSHRGTALRLLVAFLATEEGKGWLAKATGG